MIIKSYLTYLKKKSFPREVFGTIILLAKAHKTGRLQLFQPLQRADKVTYTSIFRVTRDSFGLRIAVFEGL